MTDAQPTEAQQKAAARNRAQNALNEKYRSELQSLTKAEFEAAGLTYNPKKTEEEKAEQKMRELLSQFPELATKVSGEQPSA